MNARDAVRPVECAKQAINTNVANGSVKCVNTEVGHLSCMRLRMDVLPANADKLLYVFLDFETTQIRGIRTR